MAVRLGTSQQPLWRGLRGFKFTQPTWWLRNTSQRRDRITGGYICSPLMLYRSAVWPPYCITSTSGGPQSFDMWWTGQSMWRAGKENGGGDCCRNSGGGNRRWVWTTKMQMEPTNNGTSVGLREGFWMGPPKQWQRFYRECGENTWALYRGRLRCPLAAAVPPPLFTSDKKEVSLVGGNCGMKKCDSVDPLSLVIKCLGGETSQGTW